MSKMNEWIQKTSKRTNKTFYFNPKTGQSLWELPKAGKIISVITETKSEPKLTKKKIADKKRVSKSSEDVKKDGVSEAAKVISKLKKKKDLPRPSVKVAVERPPTRSRTNLRSKRTQVSEESSDEGSPVPGKSSDVFSTSKTSQKRAHPETDASNKKGTSNDTPNLEFIGNKKPRFSEVKKPTDDASIASNNQPKEPFSENMDWEAIVNEVLQARNTESLNANVIFDTFKPSQNEASNSTLPSIHVIADTNIFLSRMDLIKDLVANESSQYRIVLVVPWRVFCELDNMKNYKRSSLNLDYLSRIAMRYLHENLPITDRISGQTLKEASNHLFTCNSADDEILNCCLQIANSGKRVALLSNDKNLCNKAFVNNIDAFTASDFLIKFVEKYRNLKSENVNVVINTPVKVVNPPVVEVKRVIQPIVEKKVEISPMEAYSKVENLLNEFFSIVLENEMKARYNEMWTHTIVIEPPWTFSAVLRCLLKHWIAVFSEVFHGNLEAKIKSLQFFYPLRRKVSKVTPDDIKMIIEDSLDLVDDLKLKSTYSLKAKELHQRLKQILNNDAPTLNTYEPTCVDSMQTDEHETPVSDDAISNTFTFIWKGFTIFCSQLADKLGVPHTLDSSSSQALSLGELILKANSVSNLLKTIIETLSRILVCFPIDSSSPEYKKFEANQALETFHQALFSTVGEMGCGSVDFDKATLSDYCNGRREILEEGFSKFSMLFKLMEECSAKCSNIQGVQ